MLTREDNELVTNTNAGTPMGELFRRFWLPIALSEELPGPDGVPLRVKMLGEQLIAFRATDGRVGLIDAYCPHRGAPLFFGRNEEDGLRCIYHGWKFDTCGNCLEMPNMPAASDYKDKVRAPSYPCLERHGILWAYLGPLDRPPAPPEPDWSELPVEHKLITKQYLECNYAQALEGDLDPSHVSFLHAALDPKGQS